MPLTKEQKTQSVEELKSLLSDSKLTVIANYSGLSVSQMQELRKLASESNTKVKVIKNRLVKVAFKQLDQFKSTETGALTSQLLYAFNTEDEVAPAQSLNKFKKTNPALEFVGAFTSQGQFVAADDVKALANLPSKEQLRGQLVGVLSAPLTGFVGVVKGNIQGVLSVLNARAESIK